MQGFFNTITMKKKTIEILATKKKPSERYNALFDVFRKVSKNRREIAAINKRGVASLLSLEYSIKKHFGIRDVEIHSFATTPSAPSKQKEHTPTYTREGLESMHYQKELRPLAAELSEKVGVDPSDQKKVTLIDFILEHSEEEDSEDVEVDLPDEAKEGATLRSIFPFLSSEDCPDEFKILVADKITAYEKWVENYKALEANKNLTNEEVLEHAKKAVEGFELDLDIMEELNYYKEHGEILGEHPIFAAHNLQKAVNAIKVVDLVTRRNNLKTYIARDSKKVEDGEIAKDKLEAFQAKIKEYEDELVLVEERIAKNDGK